MNVSATVRALVARYSMRPYDINNGDCDRFAEDLADLVPGAEPVWGDELPHLFAPGHAPEVHCFVVYRGRFYDAETPGGVATPALLPLYRRQVGQL